MSYGISSICSVTWMRAATAKKQSPCLSTSCQKVLLKTLNLLNFPFTISRRARATLFTFLIAFVVGVTGVMHLNGPPSAMLEYLLSACSNSNGGSRESSPPGRRKITSSGFGPGWCGPLIQQIRPDSMEQASSYRQPGPSNLCEYQARSNGRGSWMGQLVPSTTSKHT